ncbi:hypothetical protein [Pseudomonas donghuensis]|uniref:hypothetical protein n=1 Tax=Pseudomonas donghuensis TaxID=1163398 RepID=UPI000299D9A5|nr:hypothetical protein [Pseudomonas donghuensis]
MAKQNINLGTAPTGAGGDTPRSAFTKAQANFDELYSIIGSFGNAAARNVGTTAGQVMEVGAGGLLGLAPSVSNLHNITTTEFRSSSVATNSPPGGDGLYNLINIRSGADHRWGTVLAQEVNGYRVAFKTVAIDQSFATSWSVLYHSNNTTRAADGTLKAI